MKKRKYEVSISFQGSLAVEVEAYSEEDALRIGQQMIEDVEPIEVINSAEWDNYEVYEL